LNTDMTFLYGESRDVPGVIQQTSNGIFTALGNPDLKPGRIKMAEIAANHRFSNELLANGNVYHYWRNDDIGSVEDDESPNGRRFENLEEEELGYGFEVAFNWKPNRYWEVNAGLGFQDTSTNHNENRKAAKWTPSLSIAHETLSGWVGSVGVMGVSNRDRESGDAREPIEDYLVTNLSVESPEWVVGTTCTIEVQNLFDTNAKVDIDRGLVDDVPIWPQRIMVGVKTRFK